MTADQFTRELNRFMATVEAVAEKAGPCPVKDRLRVRPLTRKEGGGYAVERIDVFTDGTWKWKQVAWDSTEDGAYRAMELCK
jgi:hypothetical protein